MATKNHELFQQYPLANIRISVGDVSSPYQIYSGFGAFVGGDANLRLVQTLLQDEDVTPIQCSDGRTWMGIWILNFTEANLGAHTELQFSFFMSRDAVEKQSSHALGLLTALLTQPNMEMLCHGLWNNSPKVVAYNREVLSLNARLVESEVTVENGLLRFSFTDSTTGKAVLEGNLVGYAKSSLQASLGLMSQVGFFKLLQLTKQPWIGMRVVNPKGVVLSSNAAAQTFTANDRISLRFIDEKVDQFVFGDPAYQNLEFKPRYVQFFEGIKFLYLNPT